ncbi:MAG: uroporphyrinogen-III synthase [Burkholderiales bacterium]
MRVIVTRPQPQATQWVRSLTRAGIDAMALPLMVVQAVPDAAPVLAAWEGVASYDAVMFVSVTAVAQFFARKPAQTDVFSEQATVSTRAFVTGPGSRAALLHVGVAAQRIDAPDGRAPQFDSEALWAVVGLQVGPGFRLLIVRGAQASDDGEGAGRDWLAHKVRAAGGSVDFVAAYQRCAPVWSRADRALVREAASDGSLWVLSSSQAIDNLVAKMPRQSWRKAKALATHPRIAQRAKEAGFEVVCQSLPTLAAVTASIESLP